MQSGCDVIHHVLPCAVVVIQTGFCKEFFNDSNIKLNRTLFSAGCCEVYDVPLHDVLVVVHVPRR